MKKLILVFVSVVATFAAAAEVHVTIEHPETWRVSDLAPYVGQTVIFDTPMIVTSNWKYLYVSPRRIFSPTNQELPASEAYYNLLSLNSNGSLPLYNVDDYHRLGEKIYNLKAQVAANSLTFISGEWRGNTRADLEASLPEVNIRDTHTLLVCGANLEYYLAEQFDSPGPRDYEEHQKQRAKVSKALAKINADIYGLVEVQQGDAAMKEIAEDLTKNTGREFAYITDKSGANGTYTKSSFVYCTDVVETVGAIQEIEAGVKNRKKMQAFREKSSGEVFIFSINHFKAKSGYGTGSDADQGDGQGGYNASRVAEAKAVLAKYESFSKLLEDKDILIMGDLNAYAKEDPITTLIGGGMTDLHRFFHADSSYSYVYRSEAGYLDHALCNPTMLPQITGMNAYHINSDENDIYTYDSSDDLSMFRCSDHDPVLVGLRLKAVSDVDLTAVGVNSWEVYNENGDMYVRNAAGMTSPAYYRLFTIDGRLLDQVAISEEVQRIERPMQAGAYVVIVYYAGMTYKFKVIIP
jgi:hypothetical protein